MRFYQLFLFLGLISLTNLRAQQINYTVANAHSHNDYEQKQPFYLAYEEQFGSIEADIHLVDGKILVAHDAKNVSVNLSLEKLYLDPLDYFIKKNNGAPYSDSGKTLQLLIDLKTDVNNCFKEVSKYHTQ